MTLPGTSGEGSGSGPSGLTGLPGGGTPSAGSGAQMIMGTFQAIVAPFDPSMIGTIIGAGGGSPPKVPTIPGVGEGR